MLDTEVLLHNNVKTNISSLIFDYYVEDDLLKRKIPWHWFQ